MANTPTSIAIRTYQVGFGDCFLLSLKYSSKAEKHLLIDFGSTKLPPGAPGTQLRDIALDIEKRTGGKLHAVVATHRHKDHISGFARSKDGKGSGDIIRRLKPDIVVQPWTENPKLGTKATGPGKKGISSLRNVRVAALTSMQAVAGRSLTELQRLTRYVSPQVRDQLSFLGEDNLSNADAVRNLMTMGKNVYVYHGSESELRKVLPGVKVHVLGPPTVEQTDTIKKQRSTDNDEFWHLQASAMGVAQNAASTGTSLFPNHVRSRGPTYPIDTRWLIYHARAMRGEQMLQIVRMLDKTMNNTSVILVLEIGRQVLLFPGDAQIENWQYALKQPATKSLLANINLYKVGHHGSLNATPKTLWGMFKNRSKNANSPRRLKSLMSTLEGKHGSDDRGTEVPRKKLVSVLRRDTDLFSTQQLKGSNLFHDTTLTL